MRLPPTPAALLRPATRLRYFSDAPSKLKVPILLIKELRDRTDVSLSRAREALTASNLDLDGALAWIRIDNIKTGETKAAKLAERVAAEGVLALSVLSPGFGVAYDNVRAAMIELNCETDFVARSKEFNYIAAKIANSTAFFWGDEPGVEYVPLIETVPVETLFDVPLVQMSENEASPPNYTIQSAIYEATAMFGEKISLRRAATLAVPASHSPGVGFRVGAHTHGGQPLSTDSASKGVQTGQIAALVSLRLRCPTRLPKTEKFASHLRTLASSLGRQVVGFETELIGDRSGLTKGIRASPALLAQPFDMLAQENKDGEYELRPSEDSVEKVLEDFSATYALADDGGVQVLDLLRWKVGEGIEKPVRADFADEVRRMTEHLN
ncbi:hypothetical protein CALVIDRAFT_537204 [Calocera viscosa TUFC12733]|uniref:Elongation factor Ts, mitochondrial n=1 Tax=Calocera viscosa (strain TUFC12733) TaxID=1330018 RepID=A0A167M7X2_CALVF|nr:hypothetical protein CALVIDRAFT_537204 [Calocera viscosa TUFC12733]